ncbi:MAG: hypothetical protein A2Z25_22010 [Planctomycetes bacterium RBG_16_55_9]|nr:MAG: hypothetical protein A2Z25_22010 [Planctomycetes bacterium RBG_16_55_9]
MTFAGCMPRIQKPTEICPGKKSVGEALAALQSNSQNMTPFRADGQCHLEFYAEGKSKPQSENLTVQQLWVDPPTNIYFQGDKTPLPRAMILGSNDEEFWLAIRPKEISLYVWGRWSEQDSSEGPAINPRTLLEALGIGDIDAGQDWSLSNKGPYDILTKRDRGIIAKKMYIFSCDYRVRKIEFFDSRGKVAALAELDRYEEVSDGFFVPALIKVTTYDQSNEEKPFIFTLNLQRIRPTQINEQQRNYLFTRKPPKGFKNVGRIVNGDWIDESE